MQQLQDKMEIARPRLSKMADARAMELLAQHPQTLGPRVGPASEVAEQVTGGMSARLARVAGKKGGTNGRMTSMFGSGKNDRAVVEELMAAHEKDGKLDGGFIGGLLSALSPSAMSKMYGNGCCDGAMVGSGAPVEPAVLKKARAKKAMTGGAGMYAETAQRQNAPAAARVPASGATVAPGAVAPVSQMGAPEAPASFARNTVGMGRKKATHTMPDGTVMPGATHGGMKPAETRPKTPPKQIKKNVLPEVIAPPALVMKDKKPKASGGARSARGQKIAALMKGKGMTLGQASRHLKENPDA
jgi:hypothetical protein